MGRFCHLEIEYSKKEVPESRQNFAHDRNCSCPAYYHIHDGPVKVWGVTEGPIGVIPETAGSKQDRKKMKDCCQEYEDMLVLVDAVKKDAPPMLHERLDKIKEFVKGEYRSHVDAAGDAAWEGE